MTILQPIKSRVKRALVKGSLRGWEAGDQSLGGPVTVVGFFSASSGIGEGARRLYASLKAAGLEVYAYDVAGFIDPAMSKIAFKSDADPGRGPLILHVNPPEIGAVLAHFKPKNLDKRYRIGCWVWELETPPDSWKSYMPYCHELWAPSQFSANAIARFGRPCINVGYGFDAVPLATVQSPSAELKCLIVADALSSWERKNPVGGVDAFLKAFGPNDNVSLTVKLSNVSAASDNWKAIQARAAGSSQIHFLTDTMTRAQMNEVLDAHSVVINLHRSEGYGLPIAEALLRGKDSVFTAWSSPEEFTHLNGAHGIGFNFCDTNDSAGHYKGGRWAEPNLDEAVAVLRDIYKTWNTSSQDAWDRRRETIAQSAHNFFSYAAFASRNQAIINDLQD
ncbi:glycosyltransferase [Litorimonas sp. RW-G-Af-16]|uniref:glycosyltransferase n=1 Tax=Litorimonas sp. RW-G-Af-16 TaxID=3241168 RepID=UPI00390C6FE8